MKLNYHCCIAGSTQTGKTTTALKLLFEQPGLKVFFNTKNDSIWKKYFHYNVNNIEQLHEVFEHITAQDEPNFEVRICFNPNRRAEFLDIIHAVDELYYAHEKIKRYKKNLRLTIALDETHNFMTNRKTPKQIRIYWTQGLSLNKFGILISQRFGDFERVMLYNCEYFVIHQIPFQDIKDMQDKGIINETEVGKLLFKKKCGRNHNGRMCEVSHDFYFQKNVMDGIYLAKN